jgi:hypothetical protein
MRMRHSTPQSSLADLARLRVEEFSGQINRLTIRVREVVVDTIRESFANLARDLADRLLAVLARARMQTPFGRSPKVNDDPLRNEADTEESEDFESGWSPRPLYALSSASANTAASRAKGFSWAALSGLMLAWTTRLAKGTSFRPVLKLFGLHQWVLALVRLLPSR